MKVVIVCLLCLSNVLFGQTSVQSIMFDNSVSDLEKAIIASNILFGKSTSNDLSLLDEKTFLDVFSGVPQTKVSLKYLNTNPIIQEFLYKAGFLSSKSEINRAIKENSISINKDKIKDTDRLSISNLICDKYILAQRGKKNYFLIVIKH